MNVRTDVNACHYWFWLLRKVNRYDNVWVVVFSIVNTVDQGLIKVEYDSLGLRRMVEFRQLDNLV
jgi:hypothetical protein